jgi:hypothetical protein
MKIATSEIEHLREEVKNCHRIIKDLQKRREFVGLTDEERINISYKSNGNECVAVELTEATLKEKNFD